MMLEQMEQKFKPQSKKTFTINFTRDLTDEEAGIIEVYRKHHTRAMMAIILVSIIYANSGFDDNDKFDGNIEMMLYISVEIMYNSGFCVSPELFMKSIFTCDDIDFINYQNNKNSNPDFEQLMNHAFDDLVEYFVANPYSLQLSISTDLDNLTAA